MVTVHSLEEYRRLMDTRIKNLKQAATKSTRDAAKVMRDTAKKLAPHNTGATIQGIRMRKDKNGYYVESTVPGKFKQNLFANQTAPYRTLRFRGKGGSIYYAPNQIVVYGNPAISRSGNPIRWTGTPRFFHFATLRTRKYFRTVVRKNTSRALKVGFT